MHVFILLLAKHMSCNPSFKFVRMSWLFEKAYLTLSYTIQ